MTGTMGLTRAIIYSVIICVFRVVPQNRMLNKELSFYLLEHSFYLRFLHSLLSCLPSLNNSTDLTAVRTNSPSSLVSVVHSTVSSSSSRFIHCVYRIGDHVSTMLIAVICRTGRVSCVIPPVNRKHPSAPAASKLIKPKGYTVSRVYPLSDWYL